MMYPAPLVSPLAPDAQAQPDSLAHEHQQMKRNDVSRAAGFSSPIPGASNSLK
ncbi:hypothetical protein H6A12_12610 [Phocea massiliensis]|uniref:Uncharacterized protein n=1 Tax=Merdimmobilis hominis TaxID=2897707 RepID=A0A938XA16_9FIRM|nr:hypothetical protein [Merdimmobilis hominis]MBM6921981.1 hypothetical protein [Merdimmobilis hominis]